ncbi:hypothetical protein ANANG_G00208200 [Anguilla anguilla]|uniref:Uncharacterized protein n=1 Tax=Anguilla anguilla TaxID=7936 RepID=A0A9D3RQR3_ANGAN|nr:hypothetical protein ANANG_G00208200 [Anguilla anguilla]
MLGFRRDGSTLPGSRYLVASSVSSGYLVFAGAAPGAESRQQPDARQEEALKAAGPGKTPPEGAKDCRCTHRHSLCRERQLHSPPFALQRTSTPL